MAKDDLVSFSDYIARAEVKTYRKWVIVGFSHPQEGRSLLYKSCKRVETLLRYVQEGIEKGCNLFSIRGFDVTYTILPDPEQEVLQEAPS